MIGCLAALGVAIVLAVAPPAPGPPVDNPPPGPEASPWIPWLMGGAPPVAVREAPVIDRIQVVGAEYHGLARSAWYTGRNVGPRTCASRVFPRGAWLVLQAESGGPRLPVRVNDYGPADPATGTLLDVSRDVAVAQGWHKSGHARLRVWRVVVKK